MLEERLSAIKKRFDEIEHLLASPETANDREKLQTLSKEHSELKEIVEKHSQINDVEKQIKDTKAMLQDQDLKELAEKELLILEEKLKTLNQELETMLLPKDPYDEKSIFLEIRAGTGGEEAALFAGDLLRMYLRYAEKTGWKTEIIDANPTGLGGYKEVIIGIYGKGAYSKLKFESGTHRVQRVPKTESSGRIHTSAITVAVLPEIEEVDLKIEDKDLRIDAFRASGAGGQNVQKTSSAIRITHIPTGTVVSCQDERSQYQNKEKAMKVLRSKILEVKEEKLRKERAETRKIMVGTGDRSEKIRTYNFPQSRITDHRIGFSVHNLPEVLDGKLDDIIEALSTADRIAKLNKIK